MRFWAGAASVLMVLVAGALVVRAQSAVVFAASDVRSMFHISKSQNRNQVHYGLRLNAQCVPTSASPVFAYWRELEQGHDHLSELLDREQAPYGVAPGQVVSMQRGNARVEFRLRPFPDRALVASPRSRARGCAASVVTNVAGRRAVLDSIHVTIGFLWQVESITITAHTTANEVLREVLAD